MDKAKKIIISLILIMLIIVAIIIGIIIFNAKNETSGIEGDEGEIIEYNTSEYKIVDQKNMFFTAEYCVNLYLENLNNNSTSYYDREGNKVVSDEEIKKNRYNLLSSKFINVNNITVENINDKIETFEENVLFTPIKMKVKEGEKINNIIVYGMLTKSNDEYIKDIYILVNMDTENKTFSITPLSVNNVDFEKIDISYDDTNIEDKENNIYIEQDLNSELVSKQYLTYYKRLLLVKPQIIYDSLEENYKNEKFETYEQFAEYIKMNEDTIKNIYTKEYKTEFSKNMYKIIIKDQYSNIYTIYEDYIMNFKIRLDNYTILDDEILEQYNSSTNSNKASTQLARVVEAVNHKDYEFLYKRLNETFRQNNFSNLNNFKEYINSKFYIRNKLENTSFTQDGEVYIFNTRIVDTENSSNVKDLKILIKLLDETDFELSFSD